MKLLSIALAFALIAIPACADPLDHAKILRAINANSKITVLQILATRTTENGTSTAYFRSRKGTGTDTGTASFVKMDDGRWFLTSVGTYSGIRRSPFVPVDIE